MRCAKLDPLFLHYRYILIQTFKKKKKFKHYFQKPLSKPYPLNHYMVALYQLTIMNRLLSTSYLVVG